MNPTSTTDDKGSVELIVLGLLAALIVVLALPLISEIGTGNEPGVHSVAAVPGK